MSNDSKTIADLERRIARMHKVLDWLDNQSLPWTKNIRLPKWVRDIMSKELNPSSTSPSPTTEATPSGTPGTDRRE